MKKTIVFFDFDGTITRNDTFIEFIRYCSGWRRFYAGFFVLSPIIVAMRMKLIANARAKEIVFAYFFKGEKTIELQNKGEAFAKTQLPNLIRIEALKAIENHKAESAKIVVVTASFSLWIEPWCKANNIELISTQYDDVNGIITGQLKGANCNGPEKVIRIKERFNLDDFDIIYAYGNSSSDREMLQIANIKLMKWKPITD